MHHPHPFFRASRNTWYVEIDKKQHPLGKHPDGLPPPKKVKGKWNAPQVIVDEYHRRMATKEEPALAAPVTSSAVLVVELLESFMDKYATEKSERTYEHYRQFLKSFRLSLPDGLTVEALAPSHVTDWLCKHRSWSPSTKHGGIHAVKKAIRWGCKERKLGASPLAEVEAPTPTRREVVILPEQWPHILAACTDADFRDLLSFLWDSGARPQEARWAEARHFDPDNRRLVFAKSESKGKKIARVIYLNDPAFEIIRRRAKQYPEGPLFRMPNGEPWTRNAIRCRFRRQRIHKRVKLKIPGICCYAIRHSYATNALQAGIDPVTLAVLMGHADASMIANVYQHLATNPAFLLDAAKQARAARKIVKQGA